MRSEAQCPREQRKGEGSSSAALNLCALLPSDIEFHLGGLEDLPDLMGSAVWEGVASWRRCREGGLLRAGWCMVWIMDARLYGSVLIGLFQGQIYELTNVTPPRHSALQTREQTLALWSLQLQCSWRPLLLAACRAL